MSSKPSTDEHFEVSYTDLTGDRRAQTALQEVDAKAHAARFVEEGMGDLEIQKVTTTYQSVPFKAAKQPKPDGGSASGAGGDTFDAGNATTNAAPGADGGSAGD